MADVIASPVPTIPDAAPIAGAAVVKAEPIVVKRGTIADISLT
jgi:hypothetical protein